MVQIKKIMRNTCVETIKRRSGKLKFHIVADKILIHKCYVSHKIERNFYPIYIPNDILGICDKQTIQ